MKTIKAFSRYIQLKAIVYSKNKVDGKPSQTSRKVYTNSKILSILLRFLHISKPIFHFSESAP